MKCGYIRDTWDCGETMEIEEKHTGRYGARGQKRQEKKKATPKDIEKRNQWKKERDLRRLIKWNFSPGDYWYTLTFRKDERPGWEEMMKIMADFIRKLRREYKKREWELKYIYRPQIGERGAVHIHFLVNAESSDKDNRTDKMIAGLWKYGKAYPEIVYEVNDGKLANYIATPKKEWEPEKAKDYHPSRNLIRKDPKRKEVKRRSLVDKQGQLIYPAVPKGYYIDNDSVRMGINPITGYAYRHYTLVKIDRRI